MKYIPKLRLGNTIVQQPDATRTTPLLLYKQLIQQLHTPQDFARAAEQKGTTVTGSLINLGGKPTENKGNYWDFWGGRLGTNLDQLGNLGMGVAKTVGASAALATGMAYTPATIGTLGALGKGLLSGAVVDQGYSLLGGRPANIGEIGLGTGATMAMPMIFKGVSKLYGQMLPKLNSISNVTPTNTNLEALQYAQEKFKKYGYEIPGNLEEISKSDNLTKSTIKKLVDQHNTFVRGVSTNWDVIERKNPEILRHLEGKGIDWKNNPKEAAEYMATHIPIQTGYGRASLNKSVFDKGMDGLYTSNSMNTAEGYTYGDGFVVKVKKPTDYSSINMKDWIDKNQLDYYEHGVPKHKSSQEIENLKFNVKMKERFDYILNSKNPKKHFKESRFTREDYDKTRFPNGKYFQARAKPNSKLESFIFDKTYDGFTYPSIDEGLAHMKKYSELYIDRNKLNQIIHEKELFDNSMKPLLKTEHFNKNEVIDKIKNSKISELYDNIAPQIEKNSRKLSELKQDMISAMEDAIESGVPRIEAGEKSREYLINYINNQSGFDGYAHYIHLGTPGQRVLEPVESIRITPEIWKNKSRAHTNTYTKGLSLGSLTLLLNPQINKNKKE